MWVPASGAFRGAVSRCRYAPRHAPAPRGGMLNTVAEVRDRSAIWAERA
jgi:hypothetical protein